MKNDIFNNNNNNFKNNFVEKNIKKTPLNQFQMNNLSRKKYFNNSYNFSFN